MRIRLCAGGRVIDELVSRFGDEAADRVMRGDVVDAIGEVVTADAALPAGSCVYAYRDLPVEVPVPFSIEILHRDDNVLVVDKPHFLATMPRGRHVAETALVRLRRMLDLPELAPAHRLDRLTAGVLLLTVRRGARGAYQSLFAQRRVTKTYEALAPLDARLEFPMVIRSRIRKRRGVLQAEEEPGVPNAQTRVELVGSTGAAGQYRLEPRTGQTHQLRVHMNSLGIPIANDPWYPSVIEVPADDFSRPLKLLARSIAFQDPLSGRNVRYASRREL